MKNIENELKRPSRRKVIAMSEIDDLDSWDFPTTDTTKDKVISEQAEQIRFLETIIKNNAKMYEEYRERIEAAQPQKES